MTTLAIVTLLGLALTTYLKLVSGQNQMVTRSQVWNSCMPILEAGIEEALTHCQYNYVTNMVSNGWTVFNSTYVKSNQVGEGFYLTAISQSTPYEIVSRGYLPMPGSDSYVTRTVRVQTAPQGIFTGAMIMRNTINLNGNDVRSDSYDSEDPNKSTGTAYDASKAQDKGDIGCVGGLIDSVRIGNADVWGRVLTGPNGTVSVGPNGGAGSKAWHLGGNGGIQPGWWLNDMNMNFPTVQAPFVAAAPPASGTVDGENYSYVLGNGDYQLSSLAGRVAITGNAVLYVTGDVKFGSTDLLYIAPGAKLQLYVAGTETTISTIVNKNAKPDSFMYYGMPGNNSITINGNAEMTAAIYAPDARITMTGGVNFFGSLIGRDAVLNGHSAFHYDEALGRMTPTRAITITSWNEI